MRRPAIQDAPPITSRTTIRFDFGSLCFVQFVDSLEGEGLGISAVVRCCAIGLPAFNENRSFEKPGQGPL